MLKRTMQNERGSAFVELALVLPLLCLILIGAVELGRIAYYSIEVSNAARAGVAYGAQNSTTADPNQYSNVENAAVLAAADVPSLTATASDSCVCETITTSTGTIITTPMTNCTSTAYLQCPASTVPGVSKVTVNYIQVSTSATISTIFNYPGLPTSYTLNGFAKMRVLQ